ncbi:MAG: hypothetical protein ACHQK9_12555 [Reyranellales bacterium]
MTTEPYVSFVTWGRNDGYTPDYVRRVSRATTCLASQLERAGVASEIVFTEWNPSPDRPLLLDILDLPKTLQHVTLRGIVAGPEYHLRLAGSRERGIHGGEAANVGIRRARGRFITPKASDTFFSPGVIEMIARRDLDPDTMYRIDRHDITIDDDDAIWRLGDDELLAKLATLPSEPHAWIQQLPSWGLRELHTNACGDFTLLGAPYWHRLRGHPLDKTVLALDVDSLVMHAAAALGVRECRWPDTCRVYKPVHENLHGARITQVWSPWQLTLDKFLASMVGAKAAHWARTKFDYPRRKVRGVESVIGPSIERNFVEPASRWARGTSPVPTQSENWGLGDEPLEQRVLCRASWDRASYTVAR